MICEMTHLQINASGGVAESYRVAGIGNGNLGVGNES
jgi:hypothetical protein